MDIKIEDNQVHVWQTDLKTLSIDSKDTLKALSPDELERADKFRFAKDLEHFVIRRYLLRLILSKYCDCQPYELIFRYNSCKKPFICLPGSKEIKFNMSYSDDLMLVGICKHYDIGVDIEKVNEIHDLENIAIENFSPQELKYCNSKLDRTSAFFKIWTRKEAFIKARGKGLYLSLKSFCVDINSTGSFEHPVIFDRPSESKLWRTSGLITADGYMSSMAIKSDKFSILYFKLEYPV
jgi:4'-phosphopantetheinyl transferase